MKYAMRFFQKSKSINKADEIIIKYTKRETDLVRFSAEHKNIKVIANITEYIEDPAQDMDIFKCAKSECPNFTILMDNSNAEMKLIPALKDNGINFFFAHTLGGTIDKLESQVVQGASEVYITNELGFNIKALAEHYHELGVRVRVLPNVAQSSASNTKVLETYKYFFIRPEDMEMYSPYIDTIEFFGDIHNQDTFYDIYFNKKKWEDDLTYLIAGLRTPLLGNTIPPDGYYAKRRLNCRKECYRCEACDSVISIAQIMREKGYSFNAEGEVLRVDDFIRDPMQIKPTRTLVSTDGDTEQ